MITNSIKNLAYALLLAFGGAVAFCGNTTQPTKPTSAPATAPSDVTAVANSTDWITVTWKDAGKGFYYVVFRGTSANFQPSDYNEVGPPGLKDARFDDDRLDAGKRYYYKVFKVALAPPFTATLIGDVCGSTPDHDQPIDPINPPNGK